MTPEQIKALIRQEMRTNDSSNRFRLNPTNRHIHNNTDAPFVYLPYQLYAGFVPYDGDVNGILESILPAGWAITYNGTGDYTITHSLGTMLYSFVAIPAQSTNQVVSPVASSFANQVDIGWFDSTSTRQDTSFTFILMLLQGNSSAFPSYTTNNTTPIY